MAKSKNLEELTELQIEVTQKGGTERPFDNEYWDLKDEGLYLDRISGHELFSSAHKYESGTGWPSFYKSINKDELQLLKDLSLGMERTEVKAKTSGSHLGHLFKDGPRPTGLRYCMNSAALRFVPKDELSDEQRRLYNASLGD